MALYLFSPFSLFSPLSGFPSLSRLSFFLSSFLSFSFPTWSPSSSLFFLSRFCHAAVTAPSSSFLLISFFLFSSFISLLFVAPDLSTRRENLELRVRDAEREREREWPGWWWCNFGAQWSGHRQDVMAAARPWTSALFRWDISLPLLWFLLEYLLIFSRTSYGYDFQGLFCYLVV
jgi:hypothetical protein